MKLDGRTHLTYCSNIHPGERWDEVRANLERHVLAVKADVSPTAPFGVGLRLSAQAAETLSEPVRLEELRRFLREHGLYVFTLNGFPYGPFHGTRVKEDVYLPDWRAPERLAYTNRLADLLAVLLPDDDGITGTISTVPGAFKPHIRTAADVAAMVEGLLRHVAHLVALRQRTGRRIALALEPEPHCFLETTDELIRFFTDELRTAYAADRLAALAGTDRARAGQALRDHLGICLDLCHAAVEFEDPRECLTRLAAADVPIGKIQISAGLRVPTLDAATITALRRFEDAVYLHQVVERNAAGLRRFLDLPDALATVDEPLAGREWRVHFHVPIFLETLENFESTQAFIREALAAHRESPRTEHLEVETYTWDVLPEAYRRGPVTDAVARELRWVLGELAR